MAHRNSDAKIMSNFKGKIVPFPEAHRVIKVCQLYALTKFSATLFASCFYSHLKWVIIIYCYLGMLHSCPEKF
jgi:hypothetical protein